MNDNPTRAQAAAALREYRAAVKDMRTHNAAVLEGQRKYDNAMIGIFEAGLDSTPSSRHFLALSLAEDETARLREEGTAITRRREDAYAAIKKLLALTAYEDAA